ncbi:ATP-binding protein, partial [Ruminococcaceae bacterium OttesenSCG-928-L11]|nr:ATP-binding protein [Ruminococcaceae bacterium OttesenSCG-928-L11]
MLIENAVVEFKREYTSDIVKTVVAFANTGGGTIYIGIADNGSVVGVEGADETMLKLSNAVRDSIKPDVTLFVEYTYEVIEGKTIVKAEVQRGTSCPYYLGSKGIRPEGVYVRQGASTVPATETAILRMIKETDGESYEEVRSINQSLTFSDAKKEFAERGVA